HDTNSVTRLYACNLAGAILGTLIAGFVLLPAIGVRTTIITAAIVNVVVGVIALLLQRRTQVSTVAPVAESPLNRAPDTGGIFTLAAFASGFVTISAQVAWTRVLTMIIGSSTYSFSLVVALFLIGLAGGAWFVGRRDRASKLRGFLMTVELLTAL